MLTNAIDSCFADILSSAIRYLKISMSQPLGHLIFSTLYSYKTIVLIVVDLNDTGETSDGCKC